MSKIERQSWMARQQNRSLDLNRLQNHAEAMQQLQNDSVDAAKLRNADKNHDGILSSDEAFKLADSFDTDGNSQTLQAFDANNKPSQAAKVCDTLGLLMNNRELLASNTRTNTNFHNAPSVTAQSPAAIRLRSANALNAQIGDPFASGRFKFSESTLAEVKSSLGERAYERLHAYEQLINDNREADTKTKLELVNQFMHKNVFYLNDLTNSGRSDYWQSAFETVATGVGDCEDYTIAKYVALRALDVPAEQLEFTVGKLQNRGAHAVLLARTPEGPRLLDNLRVDVEPIERCRDFLPIYSANENSAYILNSNSFSRIGKKKLRNLSKVYDVLLRSQAMLREESRQRLRNAD